MTKTRQQEWEEAVELDRMLEQERNAQSKASLAKKQENNFNAYMERIKDPSLKNQSSGLSGILGSESPYYSGAKGSLPDLQQSKRERKYTSRLAMSLISLLCRSRERAPEWTAIPAVPIHGQARQGRRQRRGLLEQRQRPIRLIA